MLCLQRLYKQATRGQLNCNEHDKTIYSLNHLLKMERKHDDSMIASICDIVLQKPELRSELMMFVAREHQTVSTMLDEESTRNPSEHLQKLERAMSGLTARSGGGGADDVSNGATLTASGRNSRATPQQPASRSPQPAPPPAVAPAAVDDDDVTRSTKHNEVNESERRRRRKKRHTRNDAPKPAAKENSDLIGAGIETQAKTPAYPVGGMNGGKPIDDPELADYVKSLENTVDDGLRVLLDTHSNQTDLKKSDSTRRKSKRGLSKRKSKV